MFPHHILLHREWNRDCATAFHGPAPHLFHRLGRTFSPTSKILRHDTRFPTGPPMRNQVSHRSAPNWPATFLLLVLLASPVATWAQAPGSAIPTSTQALHKVILTSTKAPSKVIPPWGKAAGTGAPTHPEPKQMANRREEAGRTEVRMGLSWFDLEGDRSSTALEFSFRPSLELPLDARLQFGVMGNGDGGFYAYGGITRAFHLWGIPTGPVDQRWPL